LLEFSGVPVPANPMALIDRDTQGFKKQLKSWASDTIKACEGGDCPRQTSASIGANANSQANYGYQTTTNGTWTSTVPSITIGSVNVGKSITDADKSDLLAAIGKESLVDLSAYHRRLHMQSAQGNIMTGFSQADMNWLHSQVETAMCAWHKKDDPPTKCPDPSPLEWGKGWTGEDAVDKCAHVTEVTGRIRDRENNKPKEGEVVATKEYEALEKRVAELEATVKEGRVLSTKNTADLKSAVDHHTQGTNLVSGVLAQVTGKPAPADADQGDQAPPKPEPKAAEPVMDVSYPLGHEVAEIKEIPTESDEITVEVDPADVTFSLKDDELITVDEDELNAEIEAAVSEALANANGDSPEAGDTEV
jgi:hypothetical protein